jgi:tetratricopeptide (TPR) repeat protein
MIKELIANGWSYHNTQSEKLASELEESVHQLDAEQGIPYLKLAMHTLGEHLNQWYRLATLVENIESVENDYHHAVLAVAYFLSGDYQESQRAELAYMNSGDSLLAYIEVKLLIAKALVFSGRFDQAKALYEGVFVLIPADSVDEGFTRQVAITGNAIANELLSQPERSESVNSLMEMSAYHSLDFWSQCGTWVNRERAFYLLTLVEKDLGHFRLAVDYAKSGLELIGKNGSEPIDEAFLRLALASCSLQLGQLQAYSSELSRADNIVAQWQEESLITWYSEEKEKVRSLPVNASEDIFWKS